MYAQRNRENNYSYLNGAERPAFKARLAYVGDDPLKDGGLAQNARIPYVYAPFTKPGFEPDSQKGQVGMVDFFDLSKRLQLADGLSERSWSEILLNRPDREVFPPLSESQRPYAEWMRSGGKERF
jgi:hypothetical protein